MKTAFAYARSDKKINTSKSISEQFRQIEEYARHHSYKILNRYYDTDQAHYDKNSIGFEKMIRDALAFSPSVILLEDNRVLEIEEFGVQAALSKLREKGVELCSLSAEQNEMAVSQKSMETSFENEVNRMTLKKSNKEAEEKLSLSPKALEGSYESTSSLLERELLFRDKKTGYMFKKPGRVPFGYRADTIQIVDERQNKVHTKLIWSLEEDEAELLRVIVVELYTKRRMSYNEIRDLLNQKKVKSPQGKTWGTSSVANLLNEEKLFLYSGKSILKDERFLEEKKVEHAHPALLTESELQEALARKEENRKTATVGRSRKGNFLYTGLNFENEAIFKCDACGSRVVGYQNSSDKWFKYICSAYRTDGLNGCQNAWRLDQEWLEDSIFRGIEEKFLKEEAKNQFFMDIPKTLRAGIKHLNIEKRVLEERLEQSQVEGVRLLNALKSGMAPELLKGEMETVNQEKEQLKRKLKRVEEDITELSLIDESGLKATFDSFHWIYKMVETEDKRRVVRLFVKQIRMLPENKKIKVEFNSPTMVLKHYRDYETMFKRILIQKNKMEVK